MKRYYDHDDIEHKGIRDVGNLFDLSTDEDYYKPKIANSALITIILNIKVKEIKTNFINERISWYDQAIFKRFNK